MPTMEQVYDANPGIGRPALMREAGVSEKTARKFLEAKKILGKTPVTVVGITPKTDHPEDVWEAAKKTQKKVMELECKRYHQSISIADKKPIAIAFLSDFHCGNPHCDYEGLEMDIRTVEETEGLYAITTGDYHDNWINHSLMHLQQHQCMPLSNEITMVRDIFHRLSGKLLAVVAGNHDNRTQKLAGFDHIEDMLSGAKLLYDSGEISFSLKVHGNILKMKCRHSFKGHSIYNPTHGAEKDLRFGDSEWDVAVSGHHHVGTLFREFIHRDEKRCVVMVGAYKYHDSYGRLMNFPRTYSRGCGGMLLLPDGQRFFADNLQLIALLLEKFREE